MLVLVLLIAIGLLIEFIAFPKASIFRGGWNDVGEVLLCVIVISLLLSFSISFAFDSIAYKNVGGGGEVKESISAIYPVLSGGEFAYYRYTNKLGKHKTLYVNCPIYITSENRAYMIASYPSKKVLRSYSPWIFSPMYFFGDKEIFIDCKYKFFLPKGSAKILKFYSYRTP